MAPSVSPFPEPVCTLQDAAKMLLFPTYHALGEWLRARRKDFPAVYTKRGHRYQRVLTASECQRIRALRFTSTLPNAKSRSQHGTA